MTNIYIDLRRNRPERLLAEEFHRLICEVLTATELYLVDVSNAVTDDTCATHDYVDANMYMAEAFEKVVGQQLDGEYECDVDLWNSAWDLAKANGFSVTWD